MSRQLLLLIMAALATEMLFAAVPDATRERQSYSEPDVDAHEPAVLLTSQSEEKPFMNEVSGEFDVKVVPVDTGDDKLGMMTLEKQYHGDLNATGTGRMLTGMTDVKNSAVYVAVERVKGKLRGAEGSFLIYHTGIMHKDKRTLEIKVVPDSGTGDLAGIDGQMRIEITKGKHFYRFEYTLGPKASLEK